MASVMGEKNVAFLAVSLFFGVPILILVLTKGGAHWEMNKAGGRGGGAFRKDPQAFPPLPEDILLNQLSKLPLKDKRALMLHVSVGNIYDEAGRFSEAVEHYLLARELAMHYGEQLGSVQGSLGAAYYHQGKLKKAQRELEAGHVLVERNSPAAFDVMKNLASVRRDSGSLDDALELYNRVHKDRLLREAVTSEAWAELSNELGEAHHRKGDGPKALMYFNQAWELLQPGGEVVDDAVPVSPRRDAELATCENHIGATLHDDGKVVQALTRYRTALKVQKRALRPGHPHTAGTLMNIGRAQRDLGEPEKAMATLEEAERTLKKHAGRGKNTEATPEYGGLLALKADLLREAGKLTQAEQVAKESLEVQRIAFDGEEDNPEMAVSLNGLGSIYHDQKNYKEAMKRYMAALKINMKTVGFRNPETAASYNNLGNVYQDLGDDNSAKKYYEKTLEIQKLTVGEKSPELSVSYNNIGTILFRQQKTEEALPFFEKAVAIARAAGMPDKSPDRTIYEENLVLAQEDLKKKGKATAVAAATNDPGRAEDSDAAPKSDEGATFGDDGDESTAELEHAASMVVES